jgi:tetratricopeptide (TPR) repeat protein
VGEAVIKGEDVVNRFWESAPAHDILGQIYLAAGLRDKAVEQFRLALDRDFLPDALASQGFVHGIEGRKAEALQCLDGIHEAKRAGRIAYASSYYDAVVYAGLGLKREALDALEVHSDIEQFLQGDQNSKEGSNQRKH